MKLQFDDGIKEFEVNGGAILRFNPSDPALYDRFRGMLDRLEKLETELNGEKGDVLTQLTAYDRRIKSILNETFGLGNDFDAIFSGVNLMAVGKNGNRIVGNFLDALRPIIEEGAKAHAKAAAADAVAQATSRRAARE